MGYNYLRYKVCKWGDRCKFRHTDNMKGHRDDRNYVQSNGRHLNKWESDNPNFRRNYNINNEHINEYRRNGSHPNSHRGSYNTYNNYRYNEDNHRNLHHPRDKYNRNTFF